MRKIQSYKIVNNRPSNGNPRTLIYFSINDKNSPQFSFKNVKPAADLATIRFQIYHGLGKLWLSVHVARNAIKEVLFDRSRHSSHHYCEHQNESEADLTEKSSVISKVKREPFVGRGARPNCAFRSFVGGKFLPRVGKRFRSLIIRSTFFNAHIASPAIDHRAMKNCHCLQHNLGHGTCLQNIARSFKRAVDEKSNLRKLSRAASLINPG